MPDLEISNLPALAEAGVAATDPLAIADISASETKKVTVKDLIEAGLTFIDAASIPAAKVGTLGTDQVATGAIVNGAVTNVKLANSSVSLGGISISLGGTDATPAFNLTDATNYPTSSLTGTITNAQLAGSIANSKLANSSVSFGGISLALGGTDATPAFNLTDATGYKTTNLVGTITNAQLAGSIAVSKLISSSASIGGVSIALGSTDATPAFNLTDATNYPASSLTGTITNAQLAGSIAATKLAGGITNTQLAGSIANNKLVNSSISLGGVSVALGASDATPAFNLTDATGYPTSSLVGTITSAQLAGSIANAKLANSTVSFGGISLALGGTDNTPAFNLADATGYPTSSLVGTITNAQLAGSIDVSKLAGTTAISLGGVSISLGGTDATPSFNLTDATNYPAASLTGTISNAQLAGSIVNAKLVNSSVSLGGITVALGASDPTPAFDLQDATGYKTTNLVGTITNAQLAGSITAAKLAGGITNTQLAGSIANNKLANSSVSFGGVSVALGALDATPAFDLTDATNYPASSLTGTITNTQLAGSIDVSKLTSSSASVGGVTITLGTTDATPAFDLQDATGYPTTALVGTITNTQLAGSIAATKLVSGSITSTQLGANSVTDSELANNAVDTGAVQNGAITNDKVETSTSATTGLDGATKIRDASITPVKLNTSNLDRSLNVASGNLGINNTVTAATRSGITYNAQGLITGTVALAASDLPKATTSAVGGVSVGTGLSVSGAGALSLTNSVTGTTVSGITFNNQGMITAATTLTAANLPVATTSAKGAVQITSGGGLTVDGSGNLTTSTSGISAGTYQSITVNNKGVATGGAALTEGLIPVLPASKITSGSFDAARIAADSIDGSKLSNSSTAVFQSIAQNGYPTAQFSGQILFDTVSEDAYIWDGNAWQAITTLTKGSLVFGGTFNASTSKMVATTSAGIASGLAVGSNLPSPSSTTDGVYVVVSSSGTPSAPAPVVALAPPDYILGVTNTAGSSWNEVDLSQTVAGQVASNITVTPQNTLHSTNVQDALEELDTEKLAKTGGTISGQILIGTAGSLVFEGSSLDAYQTIFDITNPTQADRTITFPDLSGTVITDGDTGTVTGTMLANGTIQNVDINASAAIAFSKLAALTSAQILVGNGSNVATGVAVTGDISINNAGLTSIASGVIVDGDISGSAAITGTKVVQGTTSVRGTVQLNDTTTSNSTIQAATANALKGVNDALTTTTATANAALPKAGGTMTDNLIIDNGKELRLSESDGDGTNYTGLKAQAQTGDITLTLPAVAPTSGQVLKANASTPTTLEWGTDSATDSTKMPLAGGTFTGDVTFTGDSSDGLWDKSASAFVANLTGNVTGNVTGNTSGSAGSCTGNAATATALATARTIGGVSFDGTANINLPGVNASGTQDTSGTAALATEFTVTANNSTDETVYPLFVDAATGSQGAETDTGLSYNPSTGLLTSTGFSGAGTSLTALNASNLSSGTVNVARLGSGSSVSTKFLRGDNTWQTISSTPEGTAILSTGESGGTKFLREDGDGTCSWQAVSTDLVNDTTPQLGGNLDVNTKNILFGDSSDGTSDDVLKFGAGTDLSIWSDGVVGIIQAPSNQGIHIGNADTENIIDIEPSQVVFNKSFVIQDADLSIRASGTQKILWDVSDNALEFSDNIKATFGAGSDLSIYSDGSKGIIAADTFAIETAGGSERVRVDSTNATFAGVITGNGSGITHLDLADATNTGTVPTARLGSGTASSSNFLRGDGSWQTVSGTTINNNADNRLITGSGTANTLEAEANFVFDASNSRVGLGVTSPETALHIAGADTSIIRLENTDTSLTTDQLVGGLEFEKNDGAGVGPGVCGGVRLKTEDNNGSEFYLAFNTTGKPNDGSSTTNDFEAMRIASTGRVGIGVVPSGHAADGYSGYLQVSRDSFYPVAEFMNRGNNSGASEISLRKHKNNGSTAVIDNDGVGNIAFRGDDDAGNVTAYAEIKVISPDVSNGSEDGQLAIHTIVDGTSAARLTVDSSGNTNITGELEADNLAVVNGTSTAALVVGPEDGNGTRYKLQYTSGGGNIDEQVGGSGIQVSKTLKISQNYNVNSIAGTGLFNCNAGNGTVSLFHSGNTKLQTSSSGVTVTGTLAATAVTDDKGNLRSIPSNAQSSAYVAVAADAGKAIYISTGGVTINNSVFSAGDAVTIINNSGSDQTITKGSGVTLYNTADATDANRTLAQRGMATIWFASASVAYISGAGLS